MPNYIIRSLPTRLLFTFRGNYAIMKAYSGIPAAQLAKVGNIFILEK